VSLNEATRLRATEVVARFGERLRGALGVAPRVVAGHDHRSASPDLFAGVLMGLRRAGCSILDVGGVHAPLAWHTLRDRTADAAVYVTGAGCDPDWNGLDFALAGPRPLGADECQVALAEGFGDGRISSHLDPTPSAPSPLVPGATTHIRRFEAYELRLEEAFHALRPLGLVVGVGPGPQGVWLRRALSRTACRLTEVPVSIAADMSVDPAALGRITSVVAEGVRSPGARVDLAVLLHEDGFGLTLFDERGERVPPDALARLVGAFPSPTSAAAWRDLVWLDDGNGLACDALFVFAAVLRKLSESDRSLSEVWP
jgi:phosphomannomutase